MAAVFPSLPFSNGTGVHKDLSDQKDDFGEWSQEAASGNGDLKHMQSNRGDLSSTTPASAADDLGRLGNGNLRMPQKQEHVSNSMVAKSFPLEDGALVGQSNNGILKPTRNDVGPSVQGDEKERVLKLSRAKIYELASSPMFLPTPSSLEDLSDGTAEDTNGTLRTRGRWTVSGVLERPILHGDPRELEIAREGSCSTAVITPSISATEEDPFNSARESSKDPGHSARPRPSTRTESTPLSKRRLSSSRATGSSRPHISSSTARSKVPPLALRFNDSKAASRHAAIEGPQPRQCLSQYRFLLFRFLHTFNLRCLPNDLHHCTYTDLLPAIFRTSLHVSNWTVY